MALPVAGSSGVGGGTRRVLGCAGCRHSNMRALQSWHCMPTAGIGRAVVEELAGLGAR